MQNKYVFSRRLKLARVSQVLIAVDILLHRDAAAIANDPSPAFIRVRFISNMLLLAEQSVFD